MLNLDPAKLLVIAVVAIILLGPDKLPQVARQVGGMWKSFNEFRHRMETEVRSNIPDLPSTADLARLTRSPTALLNHLSNMGDVNAAEMKSAEEAAAAAGPLGAESTSAGAPGSELQVEAAPVAPLPGTPSPTPTMPTSTPSPGPSDQSSFGDPSLN